MKQRTIKRLVLIIALICPYSVYADWSATGTVASDYLFNGVSQTNENPALQASIDWAGEGGLYAGVWGSNVDYGDDTSIELDGYIGYYTEFVSGLSLDAGIAQYTYHGAGYSSDGNYAEVYAKFNYANADFNMWYAWDYFGSGAGHVIVMLNYTFALSESIDLTVGVDQSRSLDDEKYQWEPDDDSYVHWQAVVSTSYQTLDVSLGVHTTDLDTYGDTKLLLMVSRTWGG